LSGLSSCYHLLLLWELGLSGSLICLYVLERSLGWPRFLLLQCWREERSVRDLVEYPLLNLVDRWFWSEFEMVFYSTQTCVKNTKMNDPWESHLHRKSWSHFCCCLFEDVEMTYLGTGLNHQSLCSSQILKLKFGYQSKLIKFLLDLCFFIFACWRVSPSKQSQE
jgi:hypothetical protein